MWDWKDQNTEMLNEPGFKVSDPGPLHAPILSFKIRRDEHLEIVLETETALDAKSIAEKIPSGTLRYNTETATLVHKFMDATATLTGVQTLSVSQQEDRLREIATIHELTTKLQDVSKAAYTIEWIANMPSSFMWPDSIDTVADKTTIITVSDLTVTESDERRSGSNAAARLTIAGHTLYICVPPRSSKSRAGCIVYTGAPDDETRKKVRTALSFALGVYLVETGHTLYDPTWLIVRATSISPYSLNGRALDLPIMPLTWLTDRNYQFDISREAPANGGEACLRLPYPRPRKSCLGILARAHSCSSYRARAFWGRDRGLAAGVRQDESRQDSHQEFAGCPVGQPVRGAWEYHQFRLTFRGGQNGFDWEDSKRNQLCAPERAPKGHLASARHHHWRRRGRGMEGTGSSRSWPAHSGRQGASGYPGHEATDRPFPSSALEHKRCRKLIY